MQNFATPNVTHVTLECSITGISTAPIMYKEMDGVIYDLTLEVDYTNKK